MIAPASKAATTSRHPTGLNPNKSGTYSVGIGARNDSATNGYYTKIFVDSQLDEQIGVRYPR
jgi:hypothetical protein